MAAWGLNTYGQLGDGTTTQRTIPITAIGVGAVTAVAAGTSHTAALMADGAVSMWGRNNYGQLGDGTTGDTTVAKTASVNSNENLVVTPTASAGGTVDPSDAQVVVTGGIASFTVTPDPGYKILLVTGCGGSLSGTTYTTTTIAKNCTVSVTFSSLLSSQAVVPIAAGGAYSVAVKNGSVVAWGYNNTGQLGDGTVTQRTTPVSINGIDGVTAVAAGYDHTLALKSDGTV